MHRLDLFSWNSFSCENRYRVLLAAAGQSCMHVLLFILLLQDTFLSHQIFLVASFNYSWTIGLVESACAILEYLSVIKK